MGTTKGGLAPATLQTLLAAGAWMQLRDPVQKVESWTVGIDNPRHCGWKDLATLPGQGELPKWRHLYY